MAVVGQGMAQILIWQVGSTKSQCIVLEFRGCKVNASGGYFQMFFINYHGVVDHSRSGIYSAIMVYIVLSLAEGSIYKKLLYLVTAVDVQVKRSGAKV